MTTPTSGTLSGPEKAVLFLLALEPDLAAELMASLDEDAIRQLTKASRGVHPRMGQHIDAVFEEFLREMSEPLALRARGAEGYVSRLAAKALGEDRALRLLAPPAAAPEPIDALRNARAATLAELLQEEHPQVAAAILSQLPRNQAGKVIGRMSGERQSDVLRRVAQLSEVPAELVASASIAIAEAISAAGAPGLSPSAGFDGVTFAAGLLNDLEAADRDRIMAAITDSDPELAPRVRQAMFTFEDLSKVSTRGIQTILREVQADRVVVALKTASDALSEHFFAAVSSRAAVSLREDLAALPPMRLSEVEEAQREIVEVALRLAADGQVTLPGGSGEKLV